MKTILAFGMCLVLVFAVMAGGITVTVTQTDNTTTVGVQMNEPEKAEDAAWRILERAGQSIQEDNKLENCLAMPEIAAEATIFRIRNANCDQESQIAAYKNYDNAIENCPIGFCIFDQYDRLIYRNDG